MHQYDGLVKQFVSYNFTYCLSCVSLHTFIYSIYFYRTEMVNQFRCRSFCQFLSFRQFSVCCPGNPVSVFETNIRVSGRPGNWRLGALKVKPLSFCWKFGGFGRFWLCSIQWWTLLGFRIWMDLSYTFAIRWMGKVERADFWMNQTSKEITAEIPKWL